MQVSASDCSNDYGRLAFGQNPATEFNRSEQVLAEPQLMLLRPVHIGWPGPM